MSQIRNVAVLTEYCTHEMAKATESCPWNALKFGTSREVNSKEGRAHAEGFMFAPPIAVRLEHLKESSMEPWERLSSFSLIRSSLERS